MELFCLKETSRPFLISRQCCVISDHDPMIREKTNIIIPPWYLSTSPTQFLSSSFKKMWALIYDLCYKTIGMPWNNAWRYNTKKLFYYEITKRKVQWSLTFLTSEIGIDESALWVFEKWYKIFNHFLEKFFDTNDLSFYFSFSFSFIVFHHPSSFCFFIYGRPLCKQLFPTYHEVTALNSSGCDLARLSQIGISHLFANSYWKLPVTYTFLQYKKGTCFHSIKFSLGKSALVLLSWRSIFGPCLKCSFFKFYSWHDREAESPKYTVFFKKKNTRMFLWVIPDFFN